MAQVDIFGSLLCLVGCLVVLSTSRDAGLHDSKTFINELFDMTSREQVKEDVPFEPFKQWFHSKGVYNSGVKLNLHGHLEMAESRRLMDVSDNNMFVTAWVTSSLLEAFKYGSAPRPSDEQLILALNNFPKHQDKNEQFNSSVLSFWPVSLNQTTKYWQSVPVNLQGAFEMVSDLPLPVVEKLLDLLGFEGLAKQIEEIMGEKDTYLRAFHIPPDFDDTFVNLGLGSLLYEMKDKFPVAWKLWNSHNSNITSVFDALKKYAYRPFSKDPNLNSIDPRTYFHIRGFLDQAKADEKDVALVPTWVQNIKEMRTEFNLGVGMPFEINNVDVTVCANTIFGITSSVLSGLVDAKILKDPLVAQIYENTSSLIAYEIKNNFTGRPDLALTYYPSHIEFYWFVSRTVAVIEEAKTKGPLPAPVLETVYKILQAVTEGAMTDAILSEAKREEVETVYFDDFLGDADITHDNRTLIRGEDRIFTTSMAANALMYTWTEYDDTTGKSHWKPGTPSSVIDVVNGCINWLRQHTLDGNFDPWNAFFSGSGKGFASLPFWYPANRFEYLNGTAIHDWSNIPNATFLLAIQGYVPTEEYDAMLKQKHFGLPTPTTFNGYNSDSGGFPLWSSVPYTYATTLLAVSRYDNVVG